MEFSKDFQYISNIILEVLELCFQNWLLRFGFLSTLSCYIRWSCRLNFILIKIIASNKAFNHTPIRDGDQDKETLPTNLHDQLKALEQHVGDNIKLSRDTLMRLRQACKQHCQLEYLVVVISKVEPGSTLVKKFIMVEETLMRIIIEARLSMIDFRLR